MSWPNSPFYLNMNALTRTPLSPQLALTVKGWSRLCSRHLLPTTYLLPTILPTVTTLYEHVLTNKTPYIANSFGTLNSTDLPFNTLPVMRPTGGSPASIHCCDATHQWVVQQFSHMSRFNLIINSNWII